jgi:hypothetical protein
VGASGAGNTEERKLKAKKKSRAAGVLNRVPRKNHRARKVFRRRWNLVVSCAQKNQDQTLAHAQRGNQRKISSKTKNQKEIHALEGAVLAALAGRKNRPRKSDLGNTGSGKEKQARSGRRWNQEPSNQKKHELNQTPATKIEDQDSEYKNWSHSPEARPRKIETMVLDPLRE